MYTKGEYRDASGIYGVLMNYTKAQTDIVLVKNGQVSSAFRHTFDADYGFLSNKSQEMWDILKKGLAGCKSKNGESMTFTLGSSMMHEFTKSKVDYMLEIFDNEVVGGDIRDQEEKYRVLLEYLPKDQAMAMFPKEIPYIQLTKRRVIDDSKNTSDEDEVLVRSVAEIAMTKEDTSWLKNKKYFIVNDDKTAEEIFEFLDNYDGVVSYDTETTGLRINCFGKINSDYQRQLIQYNKDHPDDQLRADRLVGLIFCVEQDVSYYFPCFNRKFENLYSKDTETRRKVIDKIKLRYTMGEYATKQSDMADYIRNTPSDQWGSDVILMERIRNILQTRHIVAHNGAFEWKVGWQYEIDTNLRDDTMIMHQIMYKFRTTTSNRGEPSNLKYLARVELGIDQWELDDFFPDFKNDNKAEVRKKGEKKKSNNKGVRIDFSYMTYEGTRIYAPTDGDVTYMLFMKYKKDMLENHREQEYIYNVEVLVACCIGYMEFYGHKIEEDKIFAVRDQTKAEIACIKSEIRQLINYSRPDELEAYNSLKARMKEFSEADEGGTKEEREIANNRTLEAVDKLDKAIADNEENTLNLGSPAQVAELFYDVLKIPIQGDKRSVGAKVIKPLVKAKDENGNPLYPAVAMYAKYKSKDTLMTKFFDNLPYYMYPGGLIFSSFGQISTATGRMSCSRPNAQQYPKAVTGIVSARPGFIMMDADYSQIEYRVLVAMSGEEHLAELFADPDNDYHTLMASLMYGVPYASVTPKMRGDAKSFNFGIPYGMGFKSLAILLTGNSLQSSVDEAKEKYELYFKDQPKTRKFFDQVKEMAQVNKYTKTFWSRYRYYSFTGPDGKESNARKAMALRQAGNAIIQGTAADVFKISVARNFSYIRKNNLLGHLLIVNMIHDEQLYEVDAQHLNVQRILRDVGENMQFKVEGFPPLFIGAGIGPAWAKAKGKMAEIHPYLLDELSKEADEMPIWRTETDEVNTNDVLDYFAKRVYEFRRKKVYDYVVNPDNIGKDIHPAIGSLLNLQFSYGHDKDKEKIDDDVFTNMCLDGFIKEQNIEGLDSSMFKSVLTKEESEEDVDYEEEDEDELGDTDENVYSGSFALIDESNEMYGSSVQDLIRIFGSFISPEHHVCGINSLNMNYKKKDELVEYLCQHLCEPNEANAMEVVFLQDGNILNRTGLYVNNIDGSEIEARIKLASAQNVAKAV